MPEDIKKAKNSKDMDLLPHAEELAKSLTLQTLRRTLGGLHYKRNGQIKMKFGPTSMATKFHAIDSLYMAKSGEGELPKRARWVTIPRMSR